MEIQKSLDELLNEATALTPEQKKQMKERAIKSVNEILNSIKIDLKKRMKINSSFFFDCYADILFSTFIIVIKKKW